MKHHTFNKETKICSASWPRVSQSTLCTTDRLELVYDVYCNAERQLHPHTATSLNLVFLHGGGMSRVVWEYYLPRLVAADPEGNYVIEKIVLIDQVNHGDSAVRNRGKLGTDFNWIDGARDVIKIASYELGSDNEQPALNVAIGHSMGGFQALACDVLSPNLFDLLILIEPVVISRQVVGSGRKRAPPGSSHISENLYNSLRLKTCDRFANESEYIHYMKNDSFFTKAHASILQNIIDFERIKVSDDDGSVRTKMEQAQNLLCYMNMESFAPFLISNVKFVSTRTIHIVGALSTWCPPENQLFLQKTLRNYHLDVVPGGSHLVNIEVPDLIVEKINHHIHEFVLTSPLRSLHIPQLSLDERMVKFKQAFNLFKNDALIKTSKSKF
ncbi:hypothetical protein SMKI_15G2340 [Saccharomyces mikatae IFO 1815]|uniref:AB hydrolase-1 domain-containing protein n=1 Tax=Saccharomyces mikatae IFO 1815 TaxID=226126 RepID=A0AA35NEZ8_SACMI|nr:uncharacterized protein SMKI_15G2340 [Saccharomyces mikatae IFO 1815]CAI4036391.1 hypothetical protein SMKI_15G2340 [Saccharomyces mikatae IFO 1815]